MHMLVEVNFVHGSSGLTRQFAEQNAAGGRMRGCAKSHLVHIWILAYELWLSLKENNGQTATTLTRGSQICVSGRQSNVVLLSLRDLSRRKAFSCALLANVHIHSSYKQVFAGTRTLRCDFAGLDCSAKL